MPSKTAGALIAEEQGKIADPRKWYALLTVHHEQHAGITAADCQFCYGEYGRLLAAPKRRRVRK